MTTKQVGWYDGERVHQMNARPVGDVPHHLAHTAGWVPVDVRDTPAAPITPAHKADAALFVGEHFTVFEPRETV